MWMWASNRLSRTQEEIVASQVAYKRASKRKCAQQIPLETMYGHPKEEDVQAICIYSVCHAPRMYDMGAITDVVTGGAVNVETTSIDSCMIVSVERRRQSGQVVERT